MNHISTICQWISTNEVSKCAEINCISFDNLYFLLKDVNLEMYVPKATIRKLLLSIIFCCHYMICMRHILEIAQISCAGGVCRAREGGRM